MNTDNLPDCRCGQPMDRLCMFPDLTMFKCYGCGRILAATTDGRLVLWYSPSPVKES